MRTQVTLHVFSGRPNPTWILTDDQDRDLQDQLSRISRPTFSKPPGSILGLGYRGFSLFRQVQSPLGALHSHVHEGIIDNGPGQLNVASPSRDLEQWLLQTAPSSINPEVAKRVSADIQKAPIQVPQLLQNLNLTATCPQCIAVDAPGYNPSFWNIPSRQPFNNCYNYANDNATNTFAQPGRAHSAPASNMSCPDVANAAHADGLASVPDFSTPRAAGQGWYVALVIWPGQDYHWYRQDSVGCWSHKPGQTAARNYDNSNKPISDPALADRGPYTNFCGYMLTKRGLVIG